MCETQALPRAECAELGLGTSGWLQWSSEELLGSPHRGGATQEEKLCGEQLKAGPAHCFQEPRVDCCFEEILGSQPLEDPARRAQD